MILVDTNVFVDVIHNDPVWLPWSLRELSKAKQKNQLLTNFVVYAELHTHNTARKYVTSGRNWAPGTSAQRNTTGKNPRRTRRSSPSSQGAQRISQAARLTTNRSVSVPRWKGLRAPCPAPCPPPAHAFVYTSFPSLRRRLFLYRDEDILGKFQ